jgi:release factor glutamine methyltransferase
VATTERRQDSSPQKTVKDLIQVTKEFFLKRGIESARLDAELLLAHVLKVTRLQLYMDMDKPLSSKEVDAYRDAVRRRGKCEPVAYITGMREFYGIPMVVSPAVLVPRPDTETLVELALEQIPVDESCHIIDVGTGSGCIAIAIAVNRPKVHVIATDISDAALDIAKKNVEAQGLEERVTLLQGDLLEPARSHGPVAAILSNPPYIRSDAEPDLMPDVIDYEPRPALFGAEVDGLGFHRRMAADAESLLEPGGFLMMEFGIHQETLIGEMDAPSLGPAEIHSDLSGMPRVALFRKKSRIV